MTTRRVLSGRYEVGEVIGHGGMADVHRGRDLDSGDHVAIKVLRREVAQDPTFQERFAREVQTMGVLIHPSIVSLVDHGFEERADGPEVSRTPFIVMELVVGRTLRELLRAGEITVERAIAYVLDVLTALESTHRAGVVHCDVKPANVMVTPEGVVKLLDFGIARSSGDRPGSATESLPFLGTPGYLSPEQVRGEPVDGVSDLYSAGCLLYELVTGGPPFSGDPISVAYQHVYEEPRPAGTAFPELDALFTQALSKSRTDRFQDAAAFREALQQVAHAIAFPDADIAVCA